MVNVMYQCKPIDATNQGRILGPRWWAGGPVFADVLLYGATAAAAAAAAAATSEAVWGEWSERMGARERRQRGKGKEQGRGEQ